MAGGHRLSDKTMDMAQIRSSSLKINSVVEGALDQEVDMGLKFRTFYLPDV